MLLWSVRENKNSENKMSFDSSERKNFRSFFPDKKIFNKFFYCYFKTLLKTVNYKNLSQLNTENSAIFFVSHLFC